MKRRRTLEPKRQRNPGALKRFVLWALAAAVLGAALAYGLHRILLAYAPAPDPETPQLYHQLPGMILAVTVLAVLAVLFFGVRGYLMGFKVRQPLQAGRMKIRRS